jgi:hypothetical protein
MTPDDLTYATFAARLRETFIVRLDSSTIVELTLVTASDVALPAVGERFSIIFSGPRERPLPQGTYTFDHPALGLFPLFIVPIGVARDELHYEAVFTRAPRPAEPTP